MCDSLGWHFPRFGASIPALLLTAIGGCGYAEYESRLNETRKYYAYLDRIEQALAPKWVAEGNVMELRVPRQFTLIPPPQPVEREEGVTEAQIIDTRQPDYFDLKFPGLLGAWQAMFNVAKPDGTQECRGYIYALSNYSLLVGKQAAEEVAFVDKLKKLMQDAFDREVKDEPPETFPPGIPISQYQPQFTYDVFSCKGVEIDGIKRTFEVYSRAQGSIVGAIVVVLPMDMEMPQKVSERIPSMMASFQFTKDPPQPGTATGSGSAPASTPPAGGGF
jgi:hypothetical protein